MDNSENQQSSSWARMLDIREDEAQQVRRRIRQLIQNETDRSIGNGPVDPETLRRVLTAALQKISYTPLTIKIIPGAGAGGKATVEIEVPNPNLN